MQIETIIVTQASDELIKQVEAELIVEDKEIKLADILEPYQELTKQLQEFRKGESENS